MNKITIPARTLRTETVATDCLHFYVCSVAESTPPGMELPDEREGEIGRERGYSIIKSTICIGTLSFVVPIGNAVDWDLK